MAEPRRPAVNEGQRQKKKYEEKQWNCFSSWLRHLLFTALPFDEQNLTSFEQFVLYFYDFRIMDLFLRIFGIALIINGKTIFYIEFNIQIKSIIFI